MRISPSFLRHKSNQGIRMKTWAGTVAKTVEEASAQALRPTGKVRTWGRRDDGTTGPREVCCRTAVRSCRVSAPSRLLVLLACFAPLPFVHAQRYLRISARLDVDEIDWRRTLPPGTAGPRPRWTNHWSVTFECTISTNVWQLEGDFTTNARDTWLFDGTNVYDSTRVVDAPPDLRARLGGSKLGAVLVPTTADTTNVTIRIYPTAAGYPPGANVSLNVPWLALCSGAYLRRPGRTVPLPVANLDDSAGDFGYSDRTRVFEDGLGLPRAVELFTSAARRQASAQRLFQNLRRSVPLPPPSGPRDGLRKFHYFVTASTNVGGWNIPLAFGFGEDIPEDVGPGFRRFKGTGAVQAIRPSSAPRGVFDVTRRQTVVDFRFRHPTKEVNGIMYSWTNSFVAPTNSPLLLATFAATVQRAPPPLAIRRRRGPWLILLLLAAAAAGPLWVRFMLRKDGCPGKAPGGSS